MAATAPSNKNAIVPAILSPDDDNADTLYSKGEINAGLLEVPTNENISNITNLRRLSGSSTTSTDSANKPRHVGEGLAQGGAIFGNSVVNGTLQIISGGVSLFTKTAEGLRNTPTTLFSNPEPPNDNTQSDIALNPIVKRKKVQHIGEGIVEGTVSLGKGFFDGVTGLVLEPYNGAKLGGALGLVKGLGRGLIGVAVLPVAGALEAVSNTVEGITNSSHTYKQLRDDSKSKEYYPLPPPPENIDPNSEEAYKLERWRHLTDPSETPRHIAEGLGQGVTALKRGFVDGFKEVVTEPVQGAKQEGVDGLRRGLGNGITNFVLKPIVGVHTLVEKAAEGFKNTPGTIFGPENNVHVYPDVQREPKHMADGMVIGAKDLSYKVMDGVQDLVHEPVVGVREEGALGFFKGVGKGSLNFVCKTAAGTLGFISKTVDGIANTPEIKYHENDDDFNNDNLTRDTENVEQK